VTLFKNHEKLGVPFSSQGVEGPAAVTVMESQRRKGVIAEEILHLFLIICRWTVQEAEKTHARNSKSSIYQQLESLGMANHSGTTQTIELQVKKPLT